MNVTTIVGTRPEIIRLSRIIPLLDRLCAHTLVHTGQNSDPQLSDVFFDELDVRAPDVHLGISGLDFAAQAGAILERVGAHLAASRPDALLILGDTNSGLSAIVAARLGIPVFHMEAGNRCFDDRVPEEVNRRIIDHSSTVLMPYTHRSKENLLREGIGIERIYVTGNPIYEVLEAFRPKIDGSDALRRLEVEARKYLLVTLHRAENVDKPERLERMLRALAAEGERLGMPVLVSVHPRTADKMKRFNVAGEGLRLLAPLGFFDFVALEKQARAVLTDSGTVQEECAIFGVPNVTLRDVTERPETLECGSNIVAGSHPEDIERALRVALEAGGGWRPPAEYLATSVAMTVAKIVLGYTSIRRHQDG
jgi:UDP-N-acetylglucosamine 2-epimerase (non-hydrolysing)